MVLVLFCITLLSSVAVGGTYLSTKGLIEASKSARMVESLRAVLPDFDNDPMAETVVTQIDGSEVVVYTARKGGEVVGYATRSASIGFGGEIILMSGFKPSGEIIRIEVLEQSETPGLGDKIVPGKSDFSVQFEGRNPSDFKLLVRKDGGDVDAITASTITSRAYLVAVTRAWEAVMQLNIGGENNAGE